MSDCECVYLEIEKGSFDDIRRRVGMLVTNFVQKLWHGTQGEYLKGSEEETNVMYEWLTVGDERTCGICDALSGKAYSTMEEVMAEYPAHVLCRCWIEVRKVMPVRPMQRFQWTPPEGW